MASAAERVEVLALGPLPVMLAAAVEQLPTQRRFEGWQAEPKYDGYLH